MEVRDAEASKLNCRRQFRWSYHAWSLTWPRYFSQWLVVRINRYWRTIGRNIAYYTGSGICPNLFLSFLENIYIYFDPHPVGSWISLRPAANVRNVGPGAAGFLSKVGYKRFSQSLGLFQMVPGGLTKRPTYITRTLYNVMNYGWDSAVLYTPDWNCGQEAMVTLHSNFRL